MLLKRLSEININTCFYFQYKNGRNSRLKLLKEISLKNTDESPGLPKL